MGAIKNTVDTPVLQVKVTLQDSKPPIWRRLLVRSDSTLADLHYIIQVAFGWQDYHLHQFIVGDSYYGVSDLDDLDDMEMQDEQEVTLGQIVAAAGAKFQYEYDFGDGWLHQVAVEKVLAPEPGRTYPVCIKGRRACPPEDVGGIWGYEHFLQAITDPNHEEHDSYLEWAGREFDPEAFDLEATNEALDALRQDGMRWPDELLIDSGQQETLALIDPEQQGTLALIDRGVAIIKPKQPFVDWVNRTVPLSEPLTLAELTDDRTAILVPNLDSRETVMEYLEPLKPLLFEIELESWILDPSKWPEGRTGAMFDAWFDIEVHSMVWDWLEMPGAEE
jgi:hypothetical protein